MEPIKYFSQADQDRWVEKVTSSKRNGTFVDVGAFDGVTTSNTYYLEKNLGWTGICIEASPQFFEHLKQIRTSVNVNKAVMPYTGTCKFTDADMAVTEHGQEVQCDTLTNILDACSAPYVIDYMSLDIEGGEVGAIESLIDSKYRFNLITVEHNLYFQGPKQKEEIYALLSELGYIRVVDNAPCLDPNPRWHMQPFEDWYAHQDYIPFANLT